MAVAVFVIMGVKVTADAAVPVIVAVVPSVSVTPVVSVMPAVLVTPRGWVAHILSAALSVLTEAEVGVNSELQAESRQASKLNPNKVRRIPLKSFFYCWQMDVTNPPRQAYALRFFGLYASSASKKFIAFSFAFRIQPKFRRCCRGTALCLPISGRPPGAA